MDKLKIRLIKSPYGRLPSHRRTLLALGLRKINDVTIKEARPEILGMIRKVGYLLEVEKLKD